MNIATIINTIPNANIREKAEATISALPEYWWHVAASSSGKYHPEFSLGEGGLLRHSIVVAYFAARLADSWGLNDREKSTVIWAALCHDGQKQGAGEGHTVHEHPVLMAKMLRDMFPGDADAELAAEVISSHMGKWTTSAYSDVVLPTPASKLQLLVAAADMIAATKDLAFKPDFFEEE